MTNIVYDFILNKVRTKDKSWWWGDMVWWIWFHYNNINHTMIDTIEKETSFLPYNYIWEMIHFNIMDPNIIFINWSDQCIYKCPYFSSTPTKISTNTAQQIVWEWTTIYFYNWDWLTEWIWKVNLDWTWEEQLVSWPAINIAVSWDYIYYSLASDWFKTYRYSISLDQSIKISDDIAFDKKILNNNLYYRSATDSYALCRIDSDGSNKINITTNICNSYSLWLSDLCYTDYGNKLYKCWLDWTNNTLLLNDDIWILYYTTLSELIYFNNTDNSIYRIESTDDINPIKMINNVSWSTNYIKVFWDFYYIKDSLAKKIPNIPNNRILSWVDSIYESDEIYNTANEIYIKSSQNIKQWTDYSIYIANDLILTEIVPWWDMLVYFDAMAWWILYWWSTSETLINNNIFIWDKIVLKKEWEEDITINITWKSYGTLSYTWPSITTNGWSFNKMLRNYVPIDKNLLNWSSKIDLEELFNTPTNTLYYKVLLTSDETNTKSSTVNIIEITK
jgi:hypothetical protein